MGSAHPVIPRDSTTGPTGWDACTHGVGTMQRRRPRMGEVLLALVCCDAAQDMAEYGIALAVIGVVAGLAAFAIANNVGSLWSRANSMISAAVG